MPAPSRSDNVSQPVQQLSNMESKASTNPRSVHKAHDRPRRRRSPKTNDEESRRGTSVREFNRRISACAKRRDLRGAMRTLRELDRHPDVSRNLFTYNAVINALVVCSQHAKADQFWEHMVTSGIAPNLVTFNTMLKSCFGGMDEDVARAFQLLKKMEERGIDADRVTLNSVINACVSAGRVTDAQQVYQQMRRRNIEPDAYTFCTLAKQARHSGDVSMLDALVLHQLHHHTLLQQRLVEDRLHISPVTFNTIADAYIRCGFPERALSLLARMQNPLKGPIQTCLEDDVIPVAPDVQTYNVRLKALRESGAPASDAFSVLDEMGCQGLEADHITLLTLADLCCRREEMSLAEGVLHAAIEADFRECEKGSPEWKSMCSNEKSWYSAKHNDNTSGLRGKSLPHSKNVLTRGANSYGHNSGRRNTTQPKNAKANAALFNSLIRGYCSLDPPNVDRAVALYQEMRRYVDTHGFSWYTADSVTYTMLVDGFARIGDAMRAELVVCEMEAAGRSNVVAYNAYLKANRGKGFKTALAILERMKRAGLRPDVVTYNTVIDFLSSEDNGSRIAQDLVLNDMPRHGVEPDLLTFNTLIKGVARNRGSKGDSGAALGVAYRWLGELQSRGLKPDEFTYQSMVSACAAAGDAHRALEFFRKVEAERAKRVEASLRFGRDSKPQTRQNHTASSSISTITHSRALRSRKLTHGVLRTYDDEAKDWMLLPHPAAYIALMRAFLSSGAKDGVDSVLLLRDEMIARGLELGRTGYTAVADAYAERADIDSTEATLRDMMAREPQHQNRKLSPVHHCIRMKALCNAGHLDDAIAILREVSNPDAAVFNVLIFACAKNKDMDRLTRVLREMEASGVQPDIITARAMTTVMRHLARTLKSFDERFAANITRYAGHGSNEVN